VHVNRIFVKILVRKYTTYLFNFIMSVQLPEKLLKQRYKLQLVSLESPSDLPGSQRPLMDSGVSPMTDLANNLSDTSLGLTPIQDSKRRLSMDSESSDSTPSPSEKLSFSIETPLSSLVNKPKRFLQTSSRLSFTVGPEEQENKENIPCGGISSPGKKAGSFGSPKHKCAQKLNSPAKMVRSAAMAAGPLSVRNSPLRDRSSVSSGEHLSPSKKLLAKKPVFKVLDEGDEAGGEDGNSRDSGYHSQNVDDLVGKKRTPFPGTMDDILQNCSIGQEEGVVPLNPSPDRAEDAVADGFDFDSMETIDEDQEGEMTKFDLSSLLSDKIILPSHLDDKQAFTNPLDDQIIPMSRPLANKNGYIPSKRPTIRRALSMLDRPTGTDFNSPISRNSDSSLSSRFKRPEPPRNFDFSDATSKRRKFNPIEATVSSAAAAGPELDAASSQVYCPPVPDDMEKRKPKFYRSHSENELSVMKSCQLKEEVENILPDSSRLYALPSLVGGDKHPSLRSITCHTLAHLMKGSFKNTVHSYRIIDARYRFEYEGGHINGAENWQHGEDEKFISAFLPTTALDAAPAFHPDNEKKREILIFHCEFSSQRGPDFYMKLRERDRQLNQNVYPALYHPECYLLHLGYKEFYSQYPELCSGKYTTMVDPKHENDLRKMRAKSKSWSGGTIMRTGRMARLHL